MPSDAVLRLQKLFKETKGGIIWDSAREKFLLTGSPNMKVYPTPLLRGADSPACR